MLPLNQTIHGDCLEVLNDLPEQSVDVIFADPPYNLQLGTDDLRRPDSSGSLVDGVKDGWDKFESQQAYDQFTWTWLAGCRRVLKDTGTIWVIGSYHNIYRVGALLMDLGYWILNDVVWVKANPLPHLRGRRFCNAHETLLWAQKNRDAAYTFNYWSLKAGNDDLQMRSDWYIPICQGRERLQVNGQKAHSTQKPEALLYRVILSSTRPGDVALDPFFGTGTTGAVAKKLGRQWIGIEQDAAYVALARDRIAAVAPADTNAIEPIENRQRRRVPFITLVEQGYLQPGQTLRLNGSGHSAVILADGRLLANDFIGSIHQVAQMLDDNPALNGWQAWYYEAGTEWMCIDRLRQEIGATLLPPEI